jgi:hypothetical protein
MRADLRTSWMAWLMSMAPPGAAGAGTAAKGAAAAAAVGSSPSTSDMIAKWVVLDEQVNNEKSEESDAEIEIKEGLV